MKVQVGYKGEWPTTETDIVRLTVNGVEFQIKPEKNTEFDSQPETGRIEIVKTDSALAPITITPVVVNKVILA